MAEAIQEIGVESPAALDALLRGATAPFVVRGLVGHWPLVAAARRSAADARALLLRHARDIPFIVSVGRPGPERRIFYDAGMAMNFESQRRKLADIFALLEASEEDAEAAPVYLSSIDVHDFFPGLHDANHVDLGARDCLASIWIGNRVTAAAHNDSPANLACVAAGRRRFTLFPPDQFANLYLGPIDNTPAGRAVAMVDPAEPDLTRFPRFQEALRHALVAELGPGDAIHIPGLWWHHVEALDRFNILLNYWWRDSPRWLGQPQEALNHAILAIRDLPPAERQHWRAMFDHYVFENTDETVKHIPEHARSVLAPLTPESAGRLRAFLLRQLGR